MLVCLGGDLVLMLRKAATASRSMEWMEGTDSRIFLSPGRVPLLFQRARPNGVSPGQNLSHWLYVILKVCCYPAHKFSRLGSVPYRAATGEISDANNCD